MVDEWVPGDDVGCVCCIPLKANAVLVDGRAAVSAGEVQISVRRF